MDIVYQDERIVVAIKPAGVISTDVRNGMPELLRRQLHTDCIRTVHRLDAPVSGLMVLARSSRAAAEISAQIRDGAFSKAYLAVLRGVPQEMSGELIDLLGRDRERRMTYVADAPGKGVQEARLRYEVLSVRDGLSLVRVELLTGRTHQIRVQFASRGLPLAGDRRTGGRPEAGERMLLDDSIRMRASACASADSGRCTAIWSPSKSALKASHTSGCS